MRHAKSGKAEHVDRRTSSQVARQSMPLLLMLSKVPLIPLLGALGHQ